LWFLLSLSSVFICVHPWTQWFCTRISGEEVPNPVVFALKVAGTICAMNALGAFLYWRGARRVLKLGADAIPNPESGS
jgi:hypothetical protein